MFALISTIDLEQPYRFCETSETQFPVTEPALFWVDCPAGVTPQTHKWDGSQFVELPPAPAPAPAPAPVTEMPTVV